MAKVTYGSLKLKLNTETNSFDFNGSTIEVLKYLPIKDKYDLIEITLQKAEYNGIYNEILLDMYFHLHLVYLYSNLTFTDKQREDELKLYDILESNGVIDAVVKAMDEEEYDYLYTTLIAAKQGKVNYSTSAGAVLRSVIQDLPKNAEAAAKLVNEFKPEQYKLIRQLAENAGMNNYINNAKA